MRLVRPFIWPAVALSIVAFATQAMGLIFPYLIGKAAFSIERHQYEEAYGAMAVIALTLFSTNVIRNFRWNQEYRRVWAPFDRLLTTAVLDRTASFSPNQAEESAGEIQDTTLRGVNALKGAARNLVGDFVPTLFGLAAALGGLFWIHPSLGLIASICFCGYAAAIHAVNRRHLSDIRKLTATESRMGRRFSARLRNMTSVILTGEADRERALYWSEHDKCSSMESELWSGYQRRMAMFREPFSVVCFIGIMYDCVRLMKEGNLSSENLIAAVWWSSSVFSSMATVGAVQRDFMESWGPIVGLLDFLDRKPRVPTPTNAIAPQAFTGMEFKGVNLSIGNTKILRDISFDIMPGDFVAFVGKSGAGKSSLMDLILGARMPDAGGSLDISGVDSRRLDQAWWRKRIGYVRQKPAFWPDKSVRENILYGLEGVSEERFDRAIDAAMLKEALKGRLDMPMGEDGCNFSGGERQRVAIAQALIREPEVILLDEATTGLDNDSERGVLDAIDRIANERRPDGNRKYTIIIIAHKMRTVSSAGFIVLLDRGSVADIGPDIELYQKSSLYKDLVDLEIWNIGIQDGKGDPAKKPDRRHARVSALVG